MFFGDYFINFFEYDDDDNILENELLLDFNLFVNYEDCYWFLFWYLLLFVCFYKCFFYDDGDVVDVLEFDLFNF